MWGTLWSKAFWTRAFWMSGQVVIVVDDFDDVCTGTVSGPTAARTVTAALVDRSVSVTWPARTVSYHCD